MGDQSSALAALSLLPVNIRTYMSAMMGNRSGPNMQHFSAADIAAIHQAAAHAMGRPISDSIAGPQGPRGVIDYQDYGGQASPTIGKSRFDEMSNPLSLLRLSATDPNFRMETTFGQARYKVNPQGQLEVSDTYNFNAPRASMQAYANREGYWQMLKDHLSMLRNDPVHFPEEIGKLLGPSQEEGKPYTMNFGPMNMGAQ